MIRERTGKIVVRCNYYSEKHLAKKKVAPKKIGTTWCGRIGIRTPETLSRSPVFKTGAFNHSAILP